MNNWQIIDAKQKNKVSSQLDQFLPQLQILMDDCCQKVSFKRYYIFMNTINEMEAKMPHNRLSHTDIALYSLSNNLDLAFSVN
jgi:hypothetical protein